MQILFVTLVFALINPFCFVACDSRKPASTGVIRGYVRLPDKIDLAATPKEAKLYVYLKDYAPKQGKEVFPWEAPVNEVLDFEINSLKSHRVAFEFLNLPKGTYGVSVLIDTGRPHVSPGSMNFTAFPGDYTGGTKDNVNLEHNQAVEVSINQGLYITIPDGYEAPLYSSE